MDESANKGMKSKSKSKSKSKLMKKKKGEMKVKGCDAAIPKARDIGRISVTGFDNDLPHEDVESGLRELYASCGKITDVYIEKMYLAGKVAYIYFVGEGAVEKALKLNGTDMGGGWKVLAEPYPFRDNKRTIITVQEYSTSLSDTEIEVAVRDLFYSCGEVSEVCIYKKGFTAVYIKGIDAPEKARELDGSYIGSRKVVVRVLTKPPRYTRHNPCWYIGSELRPGLAE